MNQNGLPNIVERKRIASLTITPQALAYDNDCLWMSSRDLGTLYRIDMDTWKVAQEIDPPGVVWAAVSSGNGEMCFTIGKGLNDDRYVYRYGTNEGFTKLFPCPDFTGSYISFDGKHLYLSQWYEERFLKFDAQGNVLREIDIGAEICGHTFVDGSIYVLRGRENKNQPQQIRRMANRAALSERGKSATGRSRRAPVCCTLTHVRRRILLVQSPCLERDNIVFAAELIINRYDTGTASLERFKKCAVATGLWPVHCGATIHR